MCPVFDLVTSHYLPQVAKKIKEKFLKEVSRVVVKVLDPYRRLDVKRGHIKTTEDFKHLAKKLTPDPALSRRSRFRVRR